MEMNVKETDVMRMLKQSSRAQSMIDQRQSENVDCFKYLDSRITNDARCTRELNPGLEWKATFSKKKTLVSCQTGSKFKEETNKVLLLEYSFVEC
jgi:hypothetical protein